MKIAFVLSGLSAGGAERVVALIAKHWVSEGGQATIIAFDNPTDPIFHDIDNRVEIIRLGIAPTPASPGKAALRTGRRVVALRQALQRTGPDLVVSFLFKINVITILAAIGLDRPVIVAERNHPGRQAGHPLWRAARALLYRRARAVILQTEASGATLPRAIASRAVVIPNPISVFPRAPEPEGMKELVAVGRLDQQKGFDLLLDAFAAVAPRHPGWRLVIWGEGQSRAALEAQRQRLGLADRVIMPGLTATPGGWVTAASAFVLSSRFEGFGNAVGEAMAAGLPVVAFDCEFGINEMICDGRDGLLVPREDTTALAHALDTVLTSKVLRSRLGKAAKIAATRYDKDTILLLWIRLFNEIGHQHS